MQPRLSIHLLGELRVVRADGTEVLPDAWRTGKTRDLLRLLALDNGHTVRSAGLIEKLWPRAPIDRGRGSLRTASSRIRTAVGSPCIVRRHDGLCLVDAWVDLDTYGSLALRSHLAAHDRQWPQALEAVRAAELLRQGDFGADDNDGGWAQAERDRLFSTRHRMLCDGAEAAIALGLFFEAQELAFLAVALDVASEGALRSLMRAYAGLGEIGHALQVFADYDSYLAEELKAVPSAETRAVRQGLLRRRRP